MKTCEERTNSIKNKVRSKRDRGLVIWTTSAVACVLIAVTVICSLPILGENAPPINAYQDDEYYPLIQKINERYQDNKYSIFDQIGNQVTDFGGLGGAAAEGSAPPMLAPTAPDDANESNSASGNGNKYEETTLNQVDGVIEGDLLKRSTTHAFYLRRTSDDTAYLDVRVYRLLGDDTQLVGTTSVYPRDNTSFPYYGIDSAEMFLNQDATRLTVFVPCLSQQGVVFTTVISLDVSSPETITEVNRVYVSGSYVSARLVDGKFLVITNFSAWRYGVVDYGKRETYVPQCGSALNADFIPINDIYLPNNCLDVGYTVFAMLNETTLDVVDSHAVYSYTSDVYVSRGYIVLARNNRYYYSDAFDYGNEINSVKANALVTSKQIMTCEIVALKYGDKIDKVGETGVEGCIKDRYSLDEKDGVLRMFTTTRHKSRPFYIEDADSLNVSLYCVDLSTMKVIASKQSFAPVGDEVKSARFDGDKAYVCTARGVIDPVFYFDLSDLDNITYVDTGEIAGFSINLIKFNDLLLGIGRGEKWGLKVELYKESDDPNAENGVISVAAYERNFSFSYLYKAHFVNAEHNLIGLQVYDYESDWVTASPYASRGKYLLLRYDAETDALEQIYLEGFNSPYNYVRAFYDHDGVYVFGQNDFTFIDLSEQ